MEISTTYALQKLKSGIGENVTLNLVGFAESVNSPVGFEFSQVIPQK